MRDLIFLFRTALCLCALHNFALRWLFPYTTPFYALAMVASSPPALGALLRRLPRGASERLAWFTRHPWHRIALGSAWLVQRAVHLGNSPTPPSPVTIVDEAIQRAAGPKYFDFDADFDAEEDGKLKRAGTRDAEAQSLAARDEYTAGLAVLLPGLYKEWLPYAPFYPLAERLAMRLRIVDAMREQMARQGLRAAPPVTKPVLIVGMPRTGSTLLHKLSSLDPRARTLRAWELRRPLPPPAALSSDARDAAVAELRKGTDVAAALHPAMRDIHFVDAEDPDECVNAYYPDPAPVYLWGAVDMRDQYDAYVAGSQQRQLRDYRHVVQLLCGDLWQQQDHTHTVLKSPHHTFHLPAAAAAFPGATMVWLHRHPREVVGSCCSMNLTFREYTCAGFESPRVLGRRVLQRLGDSVRAAIRARADLERGGGGGGKSRVQFVDVYYRDLVANPSKCVRNLYTALGLEWREELGAAIDAHMSDRRKPSHTRGRHRYAISDFGLCDADVELEFEAYLAKYRSQL